MSCGGEASFLTGSINQSRRPWGTPRQEASSPGVEFRHRQKSPQLTQKEKYSRAFSQCLRGRLSAMCVSTRDEVRVGRKGDRAEFKARSQKEAR